MKPYKANKNTKPVLWFDLKKGMWIADADVMREMIKRGLTKKEGLSCGIACLKWAFKEGKTP